jgi:hypothetical protein
VDLLARRGEGRHRDYATTLLNFHEFGNIDAT